MARCIAADLVSDPRMAVDAKDRKLAARNLSQTTPLWLTQRGRELRLFHRRDCPIALTPMVERITRPVVRSRKNRSALSENVEAIVDQRKQENPGKRAPDSTLSAIDAGAVIAAMVCSSIPSPAEACPKATWFVVMIDVRARRILIFCGSAIESSAVTTWGSRCRSR